MGFMKPSHTTEQLTRLAREHRPGLSMESVFYQSEEVYQRDIEHIFMRCWLYVGHVSQIPEAGDYFLFELAAESVRKSDFIS